MESVRINKDTCIGCGACQAIVPDVFEIGDDGLAEVIVEKVLEELESDVIDAAEGCPTGAIIIDDEE